MKWLYLFSVTMLQTQTYERHYISGWKLKRWTNELGVFGCEPISVSVGSTFCSGVNFRARRDRRGTRQRGCGCEASSSGGNDSQKGSCERRERTNSKRSDKGRRNGHSVESERDMSVAKNFHSIVISSSYNNIYVSMVCGSARSAHIPNPAVPNRVTNCMCVGSQVK